MSASELRVARVMRATPSLAALAAFCLTAAINEPTELDRRVYDWARRSYSRRAELAQLPIELFGLPGIYIPFALLVGRMLKRRRRSGASTITNAAIAGWIAVRLARLAFHRPRPPRPQRRRPKLESTFPSGHTTGVTAMAVGMARVLYDEQMLTRPQAVALGVGLPLVTGVNRVYVREHWLTDVLGGWALGVAVAMGALSRSTVSSGPGLA